MLESHPIFGESPKEFSVSELSGKIKICLEQNIGYVRVKGEISGLKIAASGHGYFNLKENDAILATTCWRPVMARLKFQPVEGMQVVVCGRISTYAGQSRYQLSAESIEPAGLGAMMQILQERRARLEKEGLFDASRKKPLPYLPKTIGVITSITGAVIQDIVHRISDRCPCRVIIWPVTVQGETASKEVSTAVEGFNCISGDKRPDVIIVARGGGSIEDLWAFNEENVVRAVAGSKIPIISAVGHETDYTLIDIAADLRAPTPTAAAEFAVPVLSDLKSKLFVHYSRILGRLKQLVSHNEQIISGYSRIAVYPANYIYKTEQRLDELTFRLLDRLPKLLLIKHNYMQSFSSQRFNPLKLLEYKALQLTHQANSINASSLRMLNLLENKLMIQSSLIASLDYKNVLKRGFALVTNENNQVISSQKQALSVESLCVGFFDGEVKATNITSHKNHIE